MRNKVIDIYPPGTGYKAISITFKVNQRVNLYPQMDNTRNSGDPFKEWPVYSNYSKSTPTNPPGCNKTAQGTIYSTRLAFLINNDSTIREKRQK